MAISSMDKNRQSRPPRTASPKKRFQFLTLGRPALLVAHDSILDNLRIVDRPSERSMQTRMAPPRLSPSPRTNPPVDLGSTQICQAHPAYQQRQLPSLHRPRLHPCQLRRRKRCSSDSRMSSRQLRASVPFASAPSHAQRPFTRARHARHRSTSLALTNGLLAQSLPPPKKLLYSPPRPIVPHPRQRS